MVDPSKNIQLTATLREQKGVLRPSKSRSERREEMTLALEYIKILVSLVGIAGLIFAGLQWQNSTRATLHEVYRNMAV
jgi:hypothetical protein